MTSKRKLFVRLVPCRCLRGEEETVTSLDYSHCSLEQVPREIFTFEKTLEELFLDANQIEELPKQLFNCQSLVRLSLPDNDLTVLPSAIANLVNLKELDISKNSIQEFPENIKNCKVLAVVEASVNPISKLPEGFTQLLSLTQLYLNDAFLEFLPASFGRLTKLQILELRENQLKNLPKSMQKLTQLERLDLGSNEFTEVPEVLEQLTTIKELWMDGNKLTFLPGMIGTLKQLSYLDVSKNNVEMMDEQVSGCENLQDLLLSSNALTQLPGSIGSLKKLTALKVDENQLMYLPDSIGGLVALEELDCSFNEIEALPPSVGQCTSLRTFAADHNFLAQLPPEVGNWKNVTVLFLHSNKLDSLPEEMGEMQRLKVINLSDNKLKSVPFSFTKLSQLTAMWLSENQSKPLIPLQKEEDLESHQTVLTNYMFPQQPRTEDYTPNSDSESFNPSLWEEQRKQRAQVAFECDEDTDTRRDAPAREGNLKRYPTPYPDELKNMVKTAQSIATRLKEDESGDELAKEAKPGERASVGVRDVGVKVIENACANGKAVEADLKATMNSVPAEPEDHEIQRAQNALPMESDNTVALVNHEDTLEGSEELSSEDDEMKVAEMRPPLIEISINQPKVLVLGKDKKDDSRDADSLLDETVANSNQNNSNCSSPSRMSDSVSLTTDSSQDTSLCTPEREARVPFIPKSCLRQEDENENQLKRAEPPFQNGNGSDTSPQGPQPRGSQRTTIDVFVEENLCVIRDVDLSNRVADTWDQINMNTSDPMDNFTGIGDVDKAGEEALKNGGRLPSDGPERTVGVTTASELPLSWSTEELSPQKRVPPIAVKSQSVANMEMGGLKPCGPINDGGLYDSGPVGRTTVPAAQGQSIVRSKSASLLSDQLLQVYPGSSASSSDLLLGSRTAPRGPVPVVAQPPPQYNIQYATSGMPRDTLWALRSPVPLDQAYLPPQHSLANTNYSNRNHAPQPLQRGPPWPTDLRPADRMPIPRGPPQRQGSCSSTASLSLQDPRRVPVPEGDYVTYRDIHASGRGPPSLTQAGPRPLSARTYSVDGPGVPRPHSARPLPHEVPERTMSVSDFNYQHVSPSKRPNVRVKSEHSLLEVPVGGRVPADWRDQVMRHIEAKKMEKEDGFGLHGLQGYTTDTLRKVPLPNGQLCQPPRQPPMARHPSREQLIDYLMMKVSQQPAGPSRLPHDLLQQEVHVKIEKNPELGFSISGGVGGRGNPFRPEDNGIFVTRVQPEGPASRLLQPGDKIIQANGYSFVNIDHGYAVSLLKTFPSTVDLIIIREASA